MAQIAPGRQELSKQQTARFGPFEISLETGELRKNGVRMRLQGKPFQILKALIEEPGRLVTRDELRARLWPADTFVDFESGLNTAVNRLRIALGDSASNPIYIETLARLGYRFIVSVEVSCVPKPVVLAPEPQPTLVGAADTHPQVVPSVPATRPSYQFPLSTRRGALIGVGVIVAFAVGLAEGLLPLDWVRSEPSFHQVTFRKGFVTDARFTPDGKSIIYSAQWNGESSRLFISSTAGAEARDLGVGKAWLASISPTAELAIFTKPNNSHRMVLERTPLNGGSARLISEGADAADWSPNGNLCIVTDKDSVSSLEFPVGRKIYLAHGYITNPRVSPGGDQVALLEHPVPGDDAGQVVVVNSSGEARVLSSGWASTVGLSWHPSGREIWFTGARSGANRALMAVDLHGHLRQIYQAPGGLELMDIASSGKVLIARNAERMTMFLGKLDDGSERDISWMDWSHAVAISADGKAVLFDETGEGGGKQYSVVLYKAAGNSFQRLGDGRAMDLSPDGQWAVTQSAEDASKLTLISVKSLQSSAVPSTGLSYRWVKFFPNGKEILFAGSYQKQPARIYRQKLPDGSPALVASGLQFQRVAVDATGKMAVGCDGAGMIVLDVETGHTHSINTPQCMSPVAFADPETVVTARQDKGFFELELLDLKSCFLKPYHRFKLPDSTETIYTSLPRMAHDLQTLVYSKQQDLSALFVVSGWK